MSNIDIEEIYSSHIETIYKFFYFRTYDMATAEDLTSQTFLIFVNKVKEHGSKLRRPEKFLYGIMHKVWLRHLQQKYRRSELLTADIEDFQSFVTEEVEGEENVADPDRVGYFISLLPPAQAKVMQLRLVEQRPLKEICEQLGKNMNYVKTTQKRAIKRLKLLIAEAELTTEGEPQ